MFQCHQKLHLTPTFKHAIFALKPSQNFGSSALQGKGQKFFCHLFSLHMDFVSQKVPLTQHNWSLSASVM